ncbi:MAG TPA: S1 family peptidase [Nocardioidaceae bacterium]|nr:S1 family peptidase [Nocardioidaceae bacterium]
MRVRPRVGGSALFALSVSLAALVATPEQRQTVVVLAAAEPDPTEDQLAWQNEFALAATAIEERFPSSFSLAEIIGNDPRVAGITFKGPIPDGVDAFLKGVPAEIRLTAGAPMNADEVDQLIIETHRAISRSGSVSALASSYDRSKGRVVAIGRPTSMLDQKSANQVEREILAGLDPNLRKPELTLSNSFESGFDDRNGGGRIEEVGLAALECTAGFNARNTINGVPFVATAGHCDQPESHENTNGASEVTLTFVAEHRGEWGDFEVHTSPEAEPAKFYAVGEWDLRDVTGIANPVLNQGLCRWGHKTGYACDTVADLSLCSTWEGYEHCRLVRMDHDEADGGDSGGPWWSGTTAYGFHHGWTECGFLWQNTCDLWSRATYLDDALNARVRTTT